MSLTGKLEALPEPLCSQYDLVSVLGDGSFALVYQIRDKETQQDFALKVIEKEPLRIRLMLDQLVTEVVIGAQVRDTPHVAQLLEATETDTHVFLRFVLCKSNLADLCNQRGCMTEREALLWLRQACLGVKELHAAGVVHRDLKPNNLLIDARGDLRICDFGYAGIAADKLSGIAGTPGYSSPECTPQTSGPEILHSKKADIYSLGACLQHLLLGRVPQGPEDLPKDVSAATLGLIQKMMMRNPRDRPSVEEVLESHVLHCVLFESWFSQWHIVMHGFSGRQDPALNRSKTSAAKHILNIAFAGA
jgi:serine/threonine protein kinase